MRSYLDSDWLVSVICPCGYTIVYPVNICSSHTQECVIVYYLKYAHVPLFKNVLNPC